MKFFFSLLVICVLVIEALAHTSATKSKPFAIWSADVGYLISLNSKNTKAGTIALITLKKGIRSWELAARYQGANVNRVGWSSKPSIGNYGQTTGMVLPDRRAICCRQGNLNCFT